MTAENSYQSYASGLLSYALAGTWGQKLMRTCALMVDASVVRLLDGLGCSVPSLTPDCALDTVGRRIRMTRAPGESAKDYRKRLQKKTDWIKSFGCLNGLQDALRALGCEDVSVVVSDDWVTAGYSERYAIVIRQPHPFGTDFEFVYGDDGTESGSDYRTWDMGDKWDGNLPAELVDVIYEICAQHRGAHAYPQTLYIILDGDLDSNLQPSSPTDKIIELDLAHLVDRG